MRFAVETRNRQLLSNVSNEMDRSQLPHVHLQPTTPLHSSSSPLFSSTLNHPAAALVSPQFASALSSKILLICRPMAKHPSRSIAFSCTVTPENRWIYACSVGAIEELRITTGVLTQFVFARNRRSTSAPSTFGRCKSTIRRSGQGCSVSPAVSIS
jgi:hypothetical protein